MKVVPEETHEAVPPVEEVPLSAPTVPVPETETEETHEEVPPAPAVSEPEETPAEPVEEPTEPTHEEVPPHIAKAKAMIRVAFSEYGRLGLAWSGGKDSTTLLALAIEVLRENTGDWSLVIVHNDTLVENPIVREHCDKSIEELRDYIVRENLPIEIRIARPSISETFWVNLVGKGYPLPYQNLRWCQRALKIKPFSKVARDLKVVLVGVREKESNARKGLINKNYKNGKSERFKQVHIAPIVDWSDEDVWEFLTTYECEWTDLRRVYDLYKSASGECPVFSQQKTVCGARFGCWVCPMVKEDKSLRNMLEEYPHLKPLYELRQWLIDFCNRPENRTGKRRNGKPLGEGKGQLTLQARQEIFKRLMDMGLLTQEEISKIKEEWKREYPEETHEEVPEPEADTIGDTSEPKEPNHEEVPEKEVPPAVYEAPVVYSQSQSKRTPAKGSRVAPANGRKSSGSPDPHRDKARELMAGLCERVRNYGLAVYEVHYQDRLAVYWERGQSSIKVYEVRYKQKDLREIEHELRHMLGLVLRADRLIAEGYSEDLVLSLLLQARDTQGKVSFVDRDNRLEVYKGNQLIKTYHKPASHETQCG